MRLSFNNDKIGLSESYVADLSPIRHQPRETASRLLLTIGSEEGDEFIRQMTEFADAWRGFMPSLVAQIIPGADHFSMRAVLDNPESDICRLIWKTMGIGPVSTTTLQAAAMKESAPPGVRSQRADAANKRRKGRIDPAANPA